MITSDEWAALGTRLSASARRSLAKRASCARVCHRARSSPFPTACQHRPEFPSHGKRWKAGLRLIYVGRVVQLQKRVFDIPDILARLVNAGVDFTLTVVGAGADEEEFKERIAQLGLSQRVFHAGVRSQEESARMMAEHDCLLLTSDVEGMPIVILEAMSAGCIPRVFTGSKRSPGAHRAREDPGSSWTLAMWMALQAF